LEQLAALERAFGARATYRVLTPFSLDPANPISIQTAARRIASFLGLEGFTFVVAVAKQDKGVGGHIELHHNEREVFIELSEDAVRFPEAVLTTLSHELTHKHLQVSGVAWAPQAGHECDNEVFTDVAAVYLGLGKLMLNGYTSQRSQTKPTPDTITTTYETLTTGYVSLGDLAFVYAVVCRMRRIAADVYVADLMPRAKGAVLASISGSSNFFDRDYHDPSVVLSARQRVLERTAPAEAILAQASSYAAHMRQLLDGEVEPFVARSKQRIQAIQTEPFREISEDVFDPCLRFLLAGTAVLDAEAFETEIRGLTRSAKLLVDSLSQSPGLIPNIHHIPKARRRPLLMRLWPWRSTGASSHGGGAK
jgi:hypothetical protein